MPPEYITHFLMFSARTSANQTQDYMDSKLDKRYAIHLLSCSVCVCVCEHTNIIVFLLITSQL